MRLLKLLWLCTCAHRGCGRTRTSPWPTKHLLGCAAGTALRVAVGLPIQLAVDQRAHLSHTLRRRLAGVDVDGAARMLAARLARHVELLGP